MATFAPGDWIIYRKQKRSTSPGPRARETHASVKGDFYTYIVEKYWIVHEVTDSGELILKTRLGKQHKIAPDDPRLRRVRWWERWLHADRFRAVQMSLATDL